MATPSAIGRLRLERQLGAGGFATVWLAHDPELDAPVAVKILAENFAAQADIRRRFVDEARLLRRVDSDHLVRVYDVGELPDGRPFFVMTYADRGTLADRLASVPPPWTPQSVVALVDAVADGLAVLHGHGVVHRDIKPVNILLRTRPDGGERVLLGDLGIAKDLQWASGLTMPTGSSGYAAPEQESYSQEIGPSTDVHALAMTAAQLLGLRPPWPATPLGDALARATAPDPQNRTPLARTFAAQLRDAAQLTSDAPNGLPPAAGSPAAGSPVPVTELITPPLRSSAGGPGRRRRTAAITAAVGAVLVVGGGWAGWSALHGGERLSPANGHVSVQIPSGWTRQADVSFPGVDDTRAGARAGSGPRSVTVAYRGGVADPSDVMTIIQPQGCTATGSRAVQVGSWNGRTEGFDSCPDGSSVDEVVLAGGGATGWTVWVEVRSVSGEPSLEKVLASLETSP